MLMHSSELGFPQDDDIRTDDFNFDDNDDCLDSRDFQDSFQSAIDEDELDIQDYSDFDDYIDGLESDFDHAVNCAGGSENFWRNWQAEQEIAETVKELS